MPSNVSNITSYEALQREQFIVKERLKARQLSLKNQMHQVPGELAAAGLNSFVPKLLRGKVSNAAINGSKKLINSYFAPENAEGRKMIGGSLKNFKVLSGVKSIFKLLRGK